MRRVGLMAAGLVLWTGGPAAAQIFWKPPVFTGAPVAPGEVGIGVALPGATPVEQGANITWQLRAALNIMSLQCRFAPTLLAQNLYETVLYNHSTELAASYATLTSYFRRTNAKPKLAQKALDHYGTLTYSGYSAVQGQLEFCTTTAQVAHGAIYAPRGALGQVAIEHIREIRNSLKATGDQQFRTIWPRFAVLYPDFADRCWDGRGQYKSKCGFHN